jgi:S-adenosylmethionine:tRNA ribosyltransferase-isomerase
MIPARTSKRFGGDTKLLALTSNGQIQHTSVRNLTEYLNPGDLLIVNRSATLPSSFRGHLLRTGEFVEIRLAAFQGPNPNNLKNWLAFSFGKGDWTTPTEERESPPLLMGGDKIIFGPELSLEVLNCKSNRLLEIKFLSSELEKNLYRYSRPIQYSYHNENLEVWDQQTIFSGPPISVEPPSASFPLTWELIISLRGKGVQIADLLHGAGISSTGSVELDQMLPLIEWYDIPARTAEEFHRAKRNGRKIVALGTTVLRAMESAWDGNSLGSGDGLTSLKITPGYKIRTANALVTGMHDVGTSHMNILDSICPLDQIRKGYSEAEQLGYRGHEFGDIAYLHCKG